MLWLLKNGYCAHEKIPSKEYLDNSLSHRLRKILRRKVILENELTFYKLTSSKNGVSAQKIRKMSGMELSRYSLNIFVLPILVKTIYQ
jgi:hypothetical protein